MPPLHLLLAAAIFLPGQVSSIFLLSWILMLKTPLDSSRLCPKDFLAILMLKNLLDCVPEITSGLVAHFGPRSLRINAFVFSFDILFLCMFSLWCYSRLFLIMSRYGAVFGLVTAAILFKHLDSGTRHVIPVVVVALWSLRWWWWLWISG